MVGVEPKGTTKPKTGRRKDLFLAASKENTRDLSPGSVSLLFLKEPPPPTVLSASGASSAPTWRSAEEKLK